MYKPGPKLQLTNGFFADFNQIARMLAIAIGNQKSGRISAEIYAETMGMSASRVKNLASLAMAFGLIRLVVLVPTDLGRIIYRHDPYLDNLGTLWLLHFVVASNERFVVWNRLVNRVISDNQRFTTTIARPYFGDLVTQYSQRSMDKHLRKELGALWNAYTVQTLRHLRYIETESDQVYVRGESEPVPAAIFGAAALLYRDRSAPGAVTLDVVRLAHSENSPGRVFGLNERQVHDLLEEADRLGLFYIESRADLDQVRFRDDVGFLDAVQRYYERA